MINCFDDGGAYENFSVRTVHRVRPEGFTRCVSNFRDTQEGIIHIES